jgi:hypothetical protein
VLGHMLFVCKGSYRKKGLREITDSASAKLHLHEVPFISLILLEFPIMLTSILAFFCTYFFLKQISYGRYPVGVFVLQIHDEKCVAIQKKTNKLYWHVSLNGQSFVFFWRKKTLTIKGNMPVRFIW